MDLALKPAQPYLNSFVKLKLASGKLDIDGAARYDKRGAAFKGESHAGTVSVS